jgi:hypothetical protein
MANQIRHGQRRQNDDDRQNARTNERIEGIRWLVVDACELIAKSEYGTDEGAYREPIVETP